MVCTWYSEGTGGREGRTLLSHLKSAVIELKGYVKSFIDIPILNISRNITKKKGMQPRKVAIFGNIDCAESVLSNI